jgi:hypothetical protein
MPQTRDEVIAAIRTAFPPGDETIILAVLDLYGTEPYERERERVQIAIVGLSAGSEEKLKELVQVAKTDYRDILAWQERGPATEAEAKKLLEDARSLLKRWGRK